ncbi:MAG: AAC(3)-I family aminoglycoside 3-N-acetyltransferase, partial [Pseudomonadota bacterium]
MAYAFRHLCAADVPVLRQLLAVFGAAFDDPKSYQSAVPGDDYLTRLLGKPHFIAIAAVDEDAGPGGAVVGGLAAYELEKF